MTRRALAFMVVATVVSAHLFAQAPPAQPGRGRGAGGRQEFPVDSAEAAVLAAGAAVARRSI
jgi:hypothetical protein